VPLLLFGALTVSPPSAEAQNKYMGAATCASSNCHGSVGPRTATNVLQNEYTTWYRHGAHSQAYNVLSNADSKKIAGLLGIKNAASADLCLKCHSTYVPNKARRGRKYRLRDGVGCESCHGAAEKYLRPHTAKNSTHAGNVKLGLIDLVSLKKRAEICLECHQGNDNQAMNHRLIGAGHPRLTYELDTYGILQPNHWEVDKDYVKRKAPYNSGRAWLVGQVTRASEMVANIRSKKRGRFGAMPELSLFYCYNCHHSLKEDQWKKRSYQGRPGVLRLNRSSLLMVAQGLKPLDAALASQYEAKVSALESAYASGNADSALAELKTMLDGAVSSLVNTASFKKSVVTQMMKEVATFTIAFPSPPYEIAEQSAMAFSALSATVDPSGAKYQKRIDAIYDGLKDEEGFDPKAYIAAVRALKGNL